MKLKLWEMVLLPLLGVVMYVSKILMEFLPNIHLLAMFITLFTVVFRVKALIPIYTFVFLTGLYAGFNLWWAPYLYIWTVLWAAVMLLPKNMSYPVATVVYIVVCGLHGLLYGTLYAPFQAFAFGLDLDGMIAWIIAGLPWDALHCIGNLLAAILIMPLAIPLKRELGKYK